MLAECDEDLTSPQLSPTMTTPLGHWKGVSPHIIQELDRQLEAWRLCLPSSYEFSGNPAPLDHLINQSYPTRTMHERLSGYLEGRYYAAKSIIYRPFVYEALHSEDAISLPEHIKRGAHTSIEAAIQALFGIGVLHESLHLLPFPTNVCRQ